MKSIISKHGVLVKTKNQVSCDLNGEAVILNHQKGIYYGLDEVGSGVWKMLERPVRFEQIERGILAEYRVDPQRCETDLVNLIRQLHSEGLIEIKDESPS